MYTHSLRIRTVCRTHRLVMQCSIHPNAKRWHCNHCLFSRVPRAVCDCCCVVDFHIQIRITLLTLNRNRHPLIGRIHVRNVQRKSSTDNSKLHLIRLRLTLRQNGGCTKAVRVRCQNRVREFRNPYTVTNTTHGSPF